LKGNWNMRPSSRFLAWVVTGALLGLAGISAQAPPAQAATCATGVVTPMHGTSVAIRPSLGYEISYLGYKITPAASNPNLWVGLSNFTGGVLRLADNQPAVLPSGAVGAGQSTYTYFMAQAPSTTSAAQSHTVTIYDGNPNQPGSTVICTMLNTIATVQEASANNSNKVNSISIAMAGSGLGAKATVTVDGDATQ